MARSVFRVQHFVTCPWVSVTRARPDNPYTLHDVRYAFEYPGGREFPIVEPELWLFVRFLYGRGRREFLVRLLWQDGPRGEEEVSSYAIPPVVFRDRREVVSRAWKLAYVRFPGAGRYTFRLSTGLASRVLAEEFILVKVIS